MCLVCITLVCRNSIQDAVLARPISRKNGPLPVPHTSAERETRMRVTPIGGNASWNRIGASRASLRGLARGTGLGSFLGSPVPIYSGKERNFNSQSHSTMVFEDRHT